MYRKTGIKAYIQDDKYFFRYTIFTALDANTKQHRRRAASGQT